MTLMNKRIGIVSTREKLVELTEVRNIARKQKRKALCKKLNAEIARLKADIYNYEEFGLTVRGGE